MRIPHARFNSQSSIPVLVVVGLAGNLLALTVFLCSPLRRITSSVYLAGQAITDLLFLTFLGLNWLASIQINVFALPGLCQTLVYVTYVVSFLSLWVIVALTFDLYASIKWRCVHRRISRPSRAVVVTAGLLLVGCATYSFSFWLTTETVDPGKQVFCLHNGHASLAITGAVVDSALTLVLPFCLLIYMNVRILYVVASLAKTRPTAARKMPRTRRHSRASRSARSRVSLPNLSDGGHASSRQPRRSSQQVILQSSVSAGGEGFSRKRVSFEDERKISLLLEEDNIRYDEESGNFLVIAKVFVSNDDTRESKEKLEALRPLCEPHSDSVRHKNRKCSLGELRRPSTGYASKRLSASISTQRRNSLQSLTIEETLSKSITNAGIQTKSRRESRRELDLLDSVNPKPLNKNSREEMVLYNKTDSKTCQCPRRYQDLFHQPPRMRRSTRNSVRPKRKHSPLTRLQYRCFRMVLSVSIVFLCLNVPSHTIRLQSLVRSIIYSDYRPTELEYQLQQFLQFFYYINFVVNVFIYSACAKNFRTACIKIHIHIADTVRQLYKKTCTAREDQSEICSEVGRENSRHVEICLNDIHLSEITPPMNKPVSPPCLIPLGPAQNRCKNRKYPRVETPTLVSSHVVSYQ
ncbi:thyrotropin-releasing hormone receptor [Elysia marginata]|uniref:Thyrotropin-releasing hormone receptor n=1 Tax=Elysia marginata TaxID=1093978 RepID=A0AAV4IN94_9GAST|nr:thyrotropin-releasing hormone receptor [Elysia marginata]